MATRRAFLKFQAAVAAAVGIGLTNAGDAAQMVSVKTLSQAKALFGGNVTVSDGQTISVTGSTASNDGYGGTFRYDRGDRRSTFRLDGLGFVDNFGRRWKRQAVKFVTPDFFKADRSGIQDSRQAWQAALDSRYKVVCIGRPRYLVIGELTASRDNVAIDLGDATLVWDGSSTGFHFGSSTANRTPALTGLRVTGGVFENARPKDGVDRQYLVVAGMKDFVLEGQTLQHISNGGIQILAACRQGRIIRTKIRGVSSYGTIRGIWLNGSNAPDYQSQLVEISSLTRKAIVSPGCIVDVQVINPDIAIAGYALYLMNAAACGVTGGTLDCSGSGLRCLAVNTYSPDFKATNVTFAGDRTSHGALVTQCSNATFERCQFKGTFGAGADIYVQYLAHAAIRACHFQTSSSINLLADMGGSFDLENCDFTAPSYVQGQRGFRIFTIDANYDGSDDRGQTAKSVPGSRMTGCRFRNRVWPGQINQQTTAQKYGNNKVGLDFCIVRDCTIYGADRMSGPEEYGLFVESQGGNTPYPVNYSYVGNQAIPPNARNVAKDAGGTGKPLPAYSSPR